MIKFLLSVLRKATGGLSSLRSLSVVGDALLTEGFESDVGWTHLCKVFPVGGAPYLAEVGNIFTPKDWLFWFRHQPGTWDQPEAGYFWSYADKRRVRTGEGAYRWFSFYRKHDAGLMRQVSVTPGQRLRLTAYAHAWSNGLSDADGGHLDNAGWSDGDPLVGFRIVSLTAGQVPPLNGVPQNDAVGNMLFVVGLDPQGGTDPFAPSVVWGEARFNYNGYGDFPPLVVEAVAAGGMVTVFLRNRGLWQFKHNDSYWDDVRLGVVSETEPEEPEPETEEPEPGWGLPRVDYPRTVVLLPPGADSSKVMRVAVEVWDRERWTIGGSADDAGLGPLTDKKVIAIQPAAWGDDLKAFFEEHYPGTVYWPLDYDTDYQFAGRLRAYALKEAGLKLAYPTTHQPPVVTSVFGALEEFRTVEHCGLDLRSSWAVYGDEILSATAGTVIVAGYEGNLGGFGYRVEVKSATPDGQTVLVRYAHLTPDIYVGVGDMVAVGDKLGRPDSTGYSTGDHLHIDVRNGDGKYVDPALLIVWPGEEEEPEPEEPEEPPEVEEPPDMITSIKLGPHVLVAAPDVTELSMVATVVKQVDAFSTAVNPNALLIGRHYCNYDAQSQRALGISPEEAAREFVMDQRGQYALNPHIRYWEGHNEPVWSDAAGMGWYARFEVERIRLMAEMGLKCVIGNFATGCPPLELWPAFLPAIEAGMEQEAILGLHEYSCPWMWWMTGGYQISPDENEGDEGWTTLRYRKVYRQYLIPAGLVIPLAITECGLDPLVNPKPPGCEGGTWSQLGPYWAANPDSLIRYTGDPALYYFQQLEWYAKELQKDPYVVGATIFCMGNWGGAWQDFDIAGTGVATRLIEYARENPAPLFNWHDYAGEYEQPEALPIPEEPQASSIPGIHDYPGGVALAAAGCAGATCLVHITVSDRHADLDLRPLTGAGIQPIVRICRGYADGTGTVPSEAEAGRWCLCVAETINGIQWGDHAWLQKLIVIFNEENNPAEWPGGWENPTTIVTPEYVVGLYNAIVAAGIDQSVMLTCGVVDPYNVVAGIHGVENDPKEWALFKWVNCTRTDWVALHAKTQSSNVREITGPESYQMFTDAPLIGRYIHLRTIEDQLGWMPARVAELPAYITELNPQRKLDGVTLGWDVNAVEWIGAAADYLDDLDEIVGWTLYRWEKAGDQVNFALCDRPEVMAWIKGRLR